MSHDKNVPAQSNSESELKFASASFANPRGRTLRTIHLYESPYNAQKLDQNHWNFQIAKSVANANQTVNFNVVWQSKAVAPNTIIDWKDQYALNWTTKVPNPGVSITLGGTWQVCELGEVFDIDSHGFWAQSSAAKAPKFIKVGKVNYKYPGIDGLHIVVGCQNGDGRFDIIYIDETALPQGATASYQPQETVQWWYETGVRTSTMISNASTAIGKVDLSAPAQSTNRHFYSTTFNYDSGKWITSADNPPDSLYAPPQSLESLVVAPVSSSQSQLFSIWPSFWEIILKLAIGENKWGMVKLGLKALLQVKYKDVEVTILNDFHIKLELGSPKRAAKNSDDIIGGPTDDITDDIAYDLQCLIDNGTLVANETWKIVPDH